MGTPTHDNTQGRRDRATADRKLGLDDDLSWIYWFGWLDGKQADMPVGQALTARLGGARRPRRVVLPASGRLEVTRAVTSRRVGGGCWLAHRDGQVPAHGVRSEGWCGLGA